MARKKKKQLTKEDVRGRSIRALKTLIENGVLFVRAAVDISDPDLTALKALLEVRSEMSRLIEIQIVAFPQDGLMACPDNRGRLRQALELGADAAGAAPHLEHTREKGIASLAFCFSAAKRLNKFVHVFCDEVDDGASRFLEVVADFTLDYEMAGMVTAIHAIALSYYAEPYAQKVMQLVKTADVNVVTCPLINSAMQGQLNPYPRGRGITRVKDLQAIGVNVCLAHDDIQTPFYPLGSGNTCCTPPAWVCISPT
ncbi:amidohydrolase family protein [Terrilactibacillus sp. S3-3]|nr:amidohydrolase family protein [Terrilactibacillus sp. S3-3]